MKITFLNSKPIDHYNIEDLKDNFTYVELWLKDNFVFGTSPMAYYQLVPRDNKKANRIVTENNIITGMQWYDNSELHRLDGPADITLIAGVRYESWHIRGTELTDEIIEWLRENNIDWLTWSNEEMLMFMLKWAK